MAKKSQVEKFRETARKLETSEDETAFDRALRRVAKAPLPPKGHKTRPKKRHE